MSEPYLIVGRGSRGVYPRLEIRKLQENTRQFTLFIHALDAIQRPGYRPEAARFQDLGGIHGLPYQRWRGDPAALDAALPEGIWGGYCNHGSVLFPSWHRPYVLAIEQSLGEAAMHLARRWTQGSTISGEIRKAWHDAAVQLRFPFWDWTDETGETEGLPDVLKPQVFQFELPDGTQSAPIENPLAFHEFGAVLPDGFDNMIWQTPLSPSDSVSYFRSWPRTYRWPSSRSTPIEDYIKINTLMRGSKEKRGSVRQLREQVGHLFCYPLPGETEETQRPSIWDEFSNTTFQSKNDSGWEPTGQGSIEAPHNSVHLLLGGLGSMANPDYAGFDPIFYLHHCNVDRILAFWEYTYNKFWVGDGYYKKDDDKDVISFTQDGGTWGESDRFKVDQSTPLEPFRNSEGGYWTPLQARFLNESSTFKQGYTYPDLVGTVEGKEKRLCLTDPLPDTDEEVEICRKILQDNFPVTPPEEGEVDLGDAKDGSWITNKDARAVPNYRRFYLFIELVGHAFGGSYSFEILHNKQVVASFAVFSRGDRTQCAACKVRRAAGGFVRGFLDIPHDVVASIIRSRREQLSTLPIEDRVSGIAQAIKESTSVRLVGAGGDLLADAVAGGGRSDFVRGEGSGVPLDAAITPKLELRSSRALKKDWSDPMIPGSGETQLDFFHHVGHGPFLTDDHGWRTA